MSIHSLYRKQTLKVTLDQAWEFFSSPKNLKKLTPETLNFTILEAPETMYEGMFIVYKVSPVLGIPLTWVTEITHIEEKVYFIDEQRVGPYTLWHHEHRFKEVEGGVELEDLIHYKLPFGVLGRALNKIFVKGEIEKIFAYRKEVMEGLIWE